MWIWLAIGSALLLGLYDVAKKQALKVNGAIEVLLIATAISAAFTSPFLSAGSLGNHLRLLVKTLLVSSSWLSGMYALKLLPITTVSTMKASRPVFVLIFSILLFSERLNAWQWAGCILAMLSLFMLSHSSKKEGISWLHSKGIGFMAISIASGVASALWDKRILGMMEPMFVQSWTNLYITVALLIVYLSGRLSGKVRGKFKWDWTIVLIAVLITAADALYFFAVAREGALLSVISMTRRSSVIVTFVCGAILFKEKRISAKAFDLLVMLAGMGCIVFGTV